MRLSTKGRYAVVAMIDLALRETLQGRSPCPPSAHVSRSRCPTSSSCSADCGVVSSWRAREDPEAAMRWAAIPNGSRWPTSSGPSMIPTPVPNGITTAAARAQLPVASRWTSFGHASTRRRSSIWKTSPGTNCWSSSASSAGTPSSNGSRGSCTCGRRNSRSRPWHPTRSWLWVRPCLSDANHRMGNACCQRPRTVIHQDSGWTTAG